MKSDKQDFILRVLLLIEFTLLAFGCTIFYLLFKEHTLAVALALGVSSCITTYTLMRSKYMSKMQVYLDEIMECLKYLDSTAENVMLVKNRHTLLPIYRRVEELKEHNRKTEEDRQHILKIVNSVAANIEIEKLLDDLMPELIDATKSNCGVFYLLNNATNKLEIKKSVGFGKNIYSEFDLVLGEGFIGLPAQNKEVKIVNDIPDDTIYMIRAFLGKIKPRSMMVVPVVNQEQPVGVFAFASIGRYSENQLEIVNLIKYYVGAAVGNGVTFEKTKRLTNELKFQNRLIQNLNDDLENKVQDRTQFLNDIIDSIKDYSIYAMDRDGVVIVWNKGAEMLFGYSAEEVVGNHIETVYPPDEVKAGYVQKRLDTAMRTGRLSENGWRFRKDGSRYYAEMAIFARYDRKGEVIGFTNVTKDITPLKNMESDLWFAKEFSSKLIESGEQAMIFCDEEGFVQTMNKMAADLLGGDLFVGRSFCDFFEDCGQVRDSIHALAETSAFGEWSFKLKGQDKNLRVHASVLINEVDYSRILCFYLYT